MCIRDRVYVELNLGDIIQKKWMECFSAKHTFKNGEHLDVYKRQVCKLCEAIKRRKRY